MTPRPPTSTLFPYTTLFRSQQRRWWIDKIFMPRLHRLRNSPKIGTAAARGVSRCYVELLKELAAISDSRPRDRKSTRLNSSHVAISYAVFCLKKKTHTQT